MTNVRKVWTILTFAHASLCGLTGPMQKALFVYLNILHRLDKSSFFQYLHTQAQNDMFWPYAYCLLVSSLKQAKVNEMKQNKRKKLYMFISNKKTTCLRKTVTYISNELLMMSNSVLSSALTPTVQYMTEWTVFGSWPLIIDRVIVHQSPTPSSVYLHVISGHWPYEKKPQNLYCLNMELTNLHVLKDIVWSSKQVDRVSSVRSNDKQIL